MNLIVFDIDDTLTKSEYQHQLAYVNTMKEFGITEINQNWSEYKHHTDSYILKKNYENNLTDKFEFSFITDFENRMSEIILSLNEVSEIDGARSFIDYLTNKTDYAISFATGSLLKSAFIKLNQTGIYHNEELVVGANEIYEREGIVKESIERAKKFYNVKSFENIISIGDGIWDLKTARNLELHFIGIGMKNYADFKAENIKVHIENWNGFDLSKAEEKLGIIKNTVAYNGNSQYKSFKYMKIKYNNKKFRAVQNTKNGETSTETVFKYQQNGNILTSEYDGGQIVSGHLIGLVDENGNIEMRYHQVNIKGELMTGICHSKPELLPNGKIRLYEEWKWTSGDKSYGKSILEEI